MLPAVALFTLFAFVAYEVSRRDLDDELGRRLEAIAASRRDPDPRQVPRPSSRPATRSDRGYQNVVKKLEALADATGAHLFVFDHELRLARRHRARTSPIGTHYFRAELDRAELERVFERGSTARRSRSTATTA